MREEPGVVTIDQPPGFPDQCLSIFEHSLRAVAAVEGEAHIVRYLNPAFCRLVGRERSEMLGRSFTEAVPERKEALLSMLDRVYRTGNPEDLVEQDEGRTPPAWWSYTVWAIPGAEEHPSGLLVQVTDATEIAVFRNQAAAMNESLLLSSLRQHELTETAETLSARLQMLLNALPVGVMIAEGPDCRVVSLNPAGARMFGVSEGESVSTAALSTYRYFHEGMEIKPEEMPLQTAISGDRNVRDLEIEVRFPDGRRWTGLFNATPLHDREGKIVGGIAVALDITERKRAEERIRQLNQELQRKMTQLGSVNRELEAFSYSISHDLRAPLRSIDGFSRALEEDYSDQLDEQAGDYINRIRSSAQRMARLIDDILQLSRTTRAELQYTTVDLSAQAQSVIEELRRAEPERKVEVGIHEGITVEGDETLLRQLLVNLLGNAWKFTSHQEVARIEFGEMREEGRRVFFVRDNGAGFDMQYADNLFLPFRRLHTESEFAGTGIGLSIVKRIIDRHGGTIRAEGETGKGATFYFTLGE